MGQQWVREIPIIREAIQYGMEEGIEKGIEKGRQEARQEARQEELVSWRAHLLTLVKGRFPTLTASAKTWASQIKVPETLIKAATKVGLATTLEEAQKALLEQDPSPETDR